MAFQKPYGYGSFIRNTRFYPLIPLLFFTACGGGGGAIKGDATPKPVTITSNEQVIPSSNPNEPPILILSSGSKKKNYAYPPSASREPVVTRAVRRQPVQKESRATMLSSSVASGSYAVQIGVYSSEKLAQNAARQARQSAASMLSASKVDIDTLEKSGKSLYRVKLAGLDEKNASEACSRLKQNQMACFVTR